MKQKRKFKYDGKMLTPISVPKIGEFDKNYVEVTDEQAKKLENHPDFKEQKREPPKKAVKPTKKDEEVKENG